MMRVFVIIGQDKRLYSLTVKHDERPRFNRRPPKGVKLLLKDRAKTYSGKQL